MKTERQTPCARADRQERAHPTGAPWAKAVPEPQLLAFGPEPTQRRHASHFYSEREPGVCTTRRLTRRRSNRASRPARQRGVVAIYVALILPILIGFLALGLDVGHAYLVRNELQNAADAAALAGAGQLRLSGTAGTWSNASASAHTVGISNTADGVTLTDIQVKTGYWNVQGSPAGLQSTSITPGTYDKPAVQVTVSRSSGNNGGPLGTYFAGVIGLSTIPVSATATAAVLAPGASGPGTLLPIAIPLCMYQNYWNASTGQPNTDASGNPIEFTMASAYHAGPCAAMQWTSFTTDANDVPTVRNLLANGNPTTMNIGDNTWVEPGTKTTLFSSVPYPADVLLPVVVDLTTHTAVPIVAFAAFHIDSSTGGSCKCITGHFITNYKVPGGHGGAGNGTYYGAYTPAVLTQ